MTADVILALRWWLVLAGLGWAAWPITRVLFGKWSNGGYLLAKAVGLIGVTYVVWIGGSWRLWPFSQLAIAVAAGVIFLGGLILRKKTTWNWKWVVVEELFFLAALLFWSWIKAHEPTINGLEKFMDYGFTASILRGDFFPPADMWFAGGTINYYYFGHLMMAVLARLSGVDLAYGFNLMLATLFGLTLTMSLAIGRQLLHKLTRMQKIGGALVIAFLVTLAGNLHPIYAFTRGYWGEDNPPPFWQIWSKVTDKEQLKEGWQNYWYPNATRFIPFTIHEFPAYSFVVSDIHGHVLSIPIVLLLVALLVEMFRGEDRKNQWGKWAVYGLVAGTAFMTNALDGPIYLALFGLLLVGRGFNKDTFISLGVAGGVFVLAVLPFLLNFKPFVNGVAINCPPAQLAGTKIGPFIFEEVEKCQKSPLWMLLVLWGFFLYCGLGLAYLVKGKTEGKKMLLIFSVFSFGLIIFAEFFYFKDIYPAHFRSNTMFKLGYQAFILMSIVSGYTIIKLLFQKPKSILIKAFLGGLIPLLFLVSIYPYFAVRSYFNQLKEYRGLYGLGWMQERFPDDLAAVNWLNKNVPGQPVMVEAAGDSYTDYERYSAFTGLPTVAGWAVHEWLWRGSYDPIAERAAEVQAIYESPDADLTLSLLRKYKVKYIVVGELERRKYLNLNEQKIASLAQPVFSQGTTTIYRINITP